MGHCPRPVALRRDIRRFSVPFLFFLLWIEREKVEEEKVEGGVFLRVHVCAS